MGETRIGVAGKVDARTIASLDALVERFQPFCDGRSSMIRILLETVTLAIDNGTLEFDLDSVKRLREKPSQHSKPELVRKVGK